MGFFDKALKKVQDVGENIAASANNVKTVVETSVQDTMEITGLKRQIRELEERNGCTVSADRKEICRICSRYG